MPPIAEDKTKTQQTSATGAQAVADAVKRVADAAVAEVNKVAPEQDYDFKIVGAPGSTFRIDGAGFSTGGTVLFGGVAAKTTGWGATRIDGTIPAGAKTGEVVVWVDEQTQFRGHLKVA